MRRFELDGISVAALWDEPTGSWQYIVIDRATNHAAIIDPVLDFDPMSGATATRNADALLAFVKEQQVTVDWILDTHRMPIIFRRRPIWRMPWVSRARLALMWSRSRNFGATSTAFRTSPLMGRNGIGYSGMATVS